jgi:hypothetical protein
MELQRNKGYVEKKPNGYFGAINIENKQKRNVKRALLGSA